MKRIVFSKHRLIGGVSRILGNLGTPGRDGGSPPESPMRSPKIWNAPLIGLILGLIGLAVGWWARQILLDDAMITFRVAENLAYGRGFVYNPGERVQVTTTPLYGMLLAVGTWVAGSAPRAALVLNIGLSGLIPSLAYDVGRRLAGPITGLGGALLLIFSPFMVMAFSMESYLYVALILAAMDAYLAGRYGLAGLLAGLTALVRGDAVLLGASLLSYDFAARLLRERRLWPAFRWQLILPAVAIPAAWYLVAIFYYGSPFPATLYAKAAQGQFNWLGVRFGDGLLAYWQQWTQAEGATGLWLMLPLVGLGLAWAIRRERPWLILVGRDALYGLVFVGLAVPAAEWYYAPLMPGLALLAARGGQAAARLGAEFLAKRTGLSRAGLAWGLALLLLGLPLGSMIPITAGVIRQHPDWKAQVYPPTARWLAQNTNAGANLATIDIGHLGYWSGRPIIDVVGLAQPDVAPQIAKGDFGYAIRHYEPDMILIGFTWLPEVQYMDWFQAAYAPRHYFKYRALDEPLLLFTRREGVKVQRTDIPPAMIQPLEADFGGQIRLTGYHITPTPSPGGVLSLTLFWQAQSRPAADWTVFVQLVDGQNEIVAQRDDKPQNGFYATPYWQPGERVVDTHIVPLASDLPAGSYDLLIGLYEVESGLRLPLAEGSDHIRLNKVSIR